MTTRPSRTGERSLPPGDFTQVGGTDTRLRCWGNESFFDSEGHGGHPTDDNAGTNPRHPVAGSWHTCWFHGPDDDVRVSCRGDDFPSARWHNRRVRDLPDITLVSQNDDPVDLLVLGTTLYVLDEDHKAFAYRLLTGARESSKDYSRGVLGLDRALDPHGFAATSDYPERDTIATAELTPGN